MDIRKMVYAGADWNAVKAAAKDEYDKELNNLLHTRRVQGTLNGMVESMAELALYELQTEIDKRNLYDYLEDYWESLNNAHDPLKTYARTVD